MKYVIAVLALAVACGLWAVLQLASGERAPGAQGECGACSCKDDCEISPPKHPPENAGPQEMNN